MAGSFSLEAWKGFLFVNEKQGPGVGDRNKGLASWRLRSEDETAGT